MSQFGVCLDIRVYVGVYELNRYIVFQEEKKRRSKEEGTISMFRPNLPLGRGQPYQHSPYLCITVIVGMKVFHQQRIASLLGAERLGEILRSPDPCILPVLEYERTRDVYILVLF